MNMGIYLFKIHNFLFSTNAIKKKLTLFLLVKHFLLSKKRGNKQTFSKINHIDNKYSQSSGHIVEELLRIIKENRHNLSNKIWTVLILQFLKLFKLVIQISLLITNKTHQLSSINPNR